VPRYYFHVRPGRLPVIDQQGVELAGDIEAALEAARQGRETAEGQALKATAAQGGLLMR
jgi:hypothetical protein